MNTLPIAADRDYGAPILSTLRPALSSRVHTCLTSRATG